MPNVKKNKYIEPKIKTLEAEMLMMICGSKECKDPKVLYNEEEVANPYWDVL